MGLGGNICSRVSEAATSARLLSLFFNPSHFLGIKVVLDDANTSLVDEGTYSLGIFKSSKDIEWMYRRHSGTYKPIKILLFGLCILGEMGSACLNCTAFCEAGDSAGWK